MSTEERLERIEKLLLMNGKEVLNMDECALYLGIDKSTLYNKVHKKEVPYYKCGNKVYFKKSEINDYMTAEKSYSVDEINREASLYTLRKRI